jgi:hypothetical protein
MMSLQDFIGSIQLSVCQTLRLTLPLLKTFCVGNGCGGFLVRQDPSGMIARACLFHF